MAFLSILATSKLRSLFLVTLLVHTLPVLGVAVWGQCGGINYTGSTQCDAGTSCVYVNDYYSQCQPSASTTTTTGGSTPTSTATKIMALGDSITGSPGCWRALLWQNLTTAGKTNIDFVGTLPAQGCGFTYDGENEGHGGYLATNVASQNLLPGWLSQTLPDIVIMHFGTNDVWSNIAPATILSAFSTLVDQMRASKATMKIGVAKIIPMNPSTCTECYQRVVDFNAAIPAWAAGKTTSASPITVVDQWTGFNTTTDTYDGVHPNDAGGNPKLSAKWYAYLYPLV